MELAQRIPDELTARIGVVPQYRRLLDRWLRRLVADGVLHQEGGRFSIPATASEPDLPSAWREATTVLEDWPGLLEYLRRCGDLLPAVLTGGTDALETIFPGGSFDTADFLFRDSVLARYYNALSGALVAARIGHRPGKPPRVMEVGAGTGGLSATLIPLVESAGGSYEFTDVSELFLTRASERFERFTSARFRSLDIESDPAEQGYPTAGYDIVVASNLLQTSPDVSETLRRLRSLLAPGGMLMVTEVTTHLDWFDVSMALLAGWDRQHDDSRPDDPILSAVDWSAAIRQAGFTDVAAFPSPDSPAEILSQHVLVAQNSGIRDALQAPVELPELSRRTAFDASRLSDAPQRADAFAARLAASAAHEREDLLVEFVRLQIAALLRLDSADRIQRKSRLMELGLDSLMAVELRSRIGKGLDLPEPLPATLAFDYPTVDAIVGLISAMLDLPAVPAMAGTGIRDAAPLDLDGGELDALSDDEVEARLLARLESLEERAR